MTDLDDLIEAALDEAPEPPSLSWVRQRARQRRRRRGLLAVGPVAAILIVIGVVAATSEGDGRVSTADDGQTSTPPPSSTSTTTSDMPDAVESGARPLEGAPSIDESDGAPAIVWTGQEFIIWGGGQALGLAYTIDEEATPIADAPIPPRRDPAGVFTGDAVYFWGGVDAGGPRSDGAVYRPQTNEWGDLPPAPLPPGAPLASAWTGTEILLFGQIDRIGTADDLVRGAAYDPERRQWRRLPDAPTPINFGNGVWTGSELVVMGSRLDNNNFSGIETTTMAYDAGANSWRRLPASGLSPQSMWIEYADDQLYAWDYGLAATTLPPRADAWHALPRIPLGERECYTRGARGPDQLLMTYCGDGAIFEPGTNTWRTITLPNTQTPPIATDDGIVFFTSEGAFLLTDE